MRYSYLEGQEFLFDGDPAQELQKKKRKSRDTAPKPRPIMVVDMRNGGRGICGPCWERSPQWLTNQLGILRASDCPFDPIPSSLAEILEEILNAKYYLSKGACRGMLRRAEGRSNRLPDSLKAALEMQSGILPPDSNLIANLKAYHINQRDEGIDLDGVSGALMATNNMQIQTFVIQSDAAKLPLSAGLQGTLPARTQKAVAFAANQRDEVRYLHDIAGALNAQPGMKQQTFVSLEYTDSRRINGSACKACSS